MTWPCEGVVFRHFWISVGQNRLLLICDGMKHWRVRNLFSTDYKRNATFDVFNHDAGSFCRCLNVPQKYPSCDVVEHVWFGEQINRRFLRRTHITDTCIAFCMLPPLLFVVVCSSCLQMMTTLWLIIRRHWLTLGAIFPHFNQYCASNISNIFSKNKEICLYSCGNNFWYFIHYLSMFYILHLTCVFSVCVFMWTTWHLSSVSSSHL